MLFSVHARQILRGGKNAQNCYFFFGGIYGLHVVCASLVNIDIYDKIARSRV